MEPHVEFGFENGRLTPCFTPDIAAAIDGEQQGEPDQQKARQELLVRLIAFLASGRCSYKAVGRRVILLVCRPSNA